MQHTRLYLTHTHSHPTLRSSVTIKLDSSSRQADEWRLGPLPECLHDNGPVGWERETKAATLPHTCMTQHTGRSLLSAVQLAVNWWCKDVQHNASRLVTCNWILCMWFYASQWHKTFQPWQAWHSWSHTQRSKTKIANEPITSQNQCNHSETLRGNYRRVTFNSMHCTLPLPNHFFQDSSFLLSEDLIPQLTAELQNIHCRLKLQQKVTQISSSISNKQIL